MNRRELELWLCGAVAPRPTAAWFTLAVLRDAFADDAAVTRWLRAPRAALDGRSAAAALRAGHAAAVETLAVAEWHRATGARSAVPNGRRRAGRGVRAGRRAQGSA